MPNKQEKMTAFGQFRILKIGTKYIQAELIGIQHYLEEHQKRMIILFDGSAAHTKRQIHRLTV